MLPLLGCCVWIGLLPMTVAPLLQRAALDWSARTGEISLTAPLAPLAWVAGMGWGLILTVVVVGLWLQRRAKGAPDTVSTWGCGYALPGPRMQYTASSFADFLVGLFRFGLHTEQRGGEVPGVFPAPGHFHSDTPDSVLDRLLYPGCRGVARGFTWLRARVQNGLVAVYLLYVAVTLFVLLLLITTI
jgi:hydrogenase-4 component B